jgi:hypothetical protein
MVNVGEVLPDEAADTGIFRDGFIGAVRILVAGNWTFYGDIINKRNGEKRNFFSENVVNVSLHDLDQVCMTHYQASIS